MVVQSFRDDVHHTEQDEELLTFVANHVGAALSRARAIEETRQRNAELSLINDVQRGLAMNLDMQAMYDLVGDRLQEIFDAQVVDIGVLDESAGLIHFPYTIEKGVRFHRRADGRHRLPEARPRNARASPVRHRDARAARASTTSRRSSRASRRGPACSCRWSSGAGRPG